MPAGSEQARHVADERAGLDAGSGDVGDRLNARGVHRFEELTERIAQRPERADEIERARASFAEQFGDRIAGIGAEGTGLRVSLAYSVDHGWAVVSDNQVSCVRREPGGDAPGATPEFDDGEITCVLTIVDGQKFTDQVEVFAAVVVVGQEAAVVHAAGFIDRAEVLDIGHRMSPSSSPPSLVT